MKLAVARLRTETTDDNKRPPTNGNCIRIARYFIPFLLFVPFGNLLLSVVIQFSKDSMSYGHHHGSGGSVVQPHGEESCHNHEAKDDPADGVDRSQLLNGKHS